MSQTTTETKQLYLCNIISLAQDKLQTNFSRILSRLNRHQQSIEQNNTIIAKLNEVISNMNAQLENRRKQERQSTDASIQKMKEEIEHLQICMKEFDVTHAKINENINNVEKGQKGLQELIDSEMKARMFDTETVREKIKNLNEELHSIGIILANKENVSEVLKLSQSMSEFNQQMSKLESEQKFMEFKLEKLEINCQKLEKNQTAKQLQLLKGLEEKIKKQLSSNLQINSHEQPSTIQTSSNPQSINNPQIIHQVQYLRSSEMDNSKEKESILVPKITFSSEMQESQKGGATSQVNWEKGQRMSSFENTLIQPNQENQLTQKLIWQLNETVNFHSHRFDVVEKGMKDMMQWYESSLKSKKSGSTEFEEKLNAIKPEFIRIWAKCDALQEKAAVFDRRMEQKNIQIGNITDILKEAQIAKFDEKLRLIQVEILTSLKQLKVKVEGKVGLIDFEKYSKTTTEKIQTLNDELILKCDKVEVKKALLFLESKIKEIILVISEEEENQKDALLTKKQLKCISCDKDVQRFVGAASNIKGNWDGFPLKEHSNDTLGRFGMTSYGTLARKLKKLDKDMPAIASKKHKESTHSENKASFH